MPRMTSWTERTYYSLEHDCEVSRLTCFDDNSQSYWMEIETGKGYAERRNAALERMMEAIESGHEPGYVEDVCP